MLTRRTRHLAMVGSRLARKGIDGKWLVFISASAISPEGWAEGLSVPRYYARDFNLDMPPPQPLDFSIQRDSRHSTVEAGSEVLSSKEQPRKRQRNPRISEGIGSETKKGHQKHAVAEQRARTLEEPLGNEHVTVMLQHCSARP
jgi:hypothetical protein